MIKIIADLNLYRLEEFLPEDTTITYYDPYETLPDLEGFDAWLLRTVTKVNSSTFPSLPGSLKFIGTGSSGSDHVDAELMGELGISFTDAKGCNARAVAEYVMTALLLYREEKGINLETLTYGIIGAGAVGTQVAEIFDTFGFTYQLYDPPREEKDSEFSSCSLEDVLSCDVLTFHVPYTHEELYPTHHWLDEAKLNGRTFELIINAARGGVIKESAVIKALEKGSIKDVVIDVWEDEPDFDPDFAVRPFIATPHIAGYSEQAKLNASKFVCQKLCDFFGLSCPETEHLYAQRKEELAHIQYSLTDLLLRLHPIKEYDSALHDLIGRPDKARLFAKLRVDRPYRFEYPFLELEDRFVSEFEELRKLGVGIIDD